MTDDSKKLDDLLRRAKMIQAQAGGDKAPAKTDAHGIPKDENTIGNAIKGLESVQKAAETINNTTKIVTASTSTAWNFVKPLWENRFSQWCWRKLKAAHSKFCYKTDKKTGERSFSKKRAGAFYLGCYTVLAAVLPFMPGAAIVQKAVVEPVADTAFLVKDAFRMQFAYQENVQVLLNRESQTSIDRNEGTYQVKVEKDGQHFGAVIKPGFLHSQWYLNNRSSLLYNTDVIAAAIPSGEVAKCTATMYGSHHPFLLYLGAKPVILEAKCETAKTSFNNAVEGATMQASFTIQQAAAPAMRAPG